MASPAPRLTWPRIDGVSSPRARRPRAVVAIDVGSTTVRCLAVNSAGVALARKSVPTNAQADGSHSTTGELCADKLWANVVALVRATLADAKLDANAVDSIGITVQRGTFVTWDCRTGEPLHPLLSWKDTRCRSLCVRWNASLRLQALRTITWLIYLVTRNPRYLAASRFQLTPQLAVSRLLWAMRHVAKLGEAIHARTARFGTVDSYLLWRLTAGAVYATDPSNACVTGLFDTFQLRWSAPLLWLFRIPPWMLPEVRHSSDDFGRTVPHIFGAAIKIRSLTGDQSASAFGHCCYRKGDVKLTLGTGTFVNINTGNRAVPPSAAGDVYPVVGWTQPGRPPTYLLETGFPHSGDLMRFAVEQLQLVDSVDVVPPLETANGCLPTLALAELAAITTAAGGASADDETQAHSPLRHFAEAQISTTISSRGQPQHAILDIIAFRTHQLLQRLTAHLQDTKVKRRTLFGSSSVKENCDNGHFLREQIDVDGGISNCDLILKTISDLERGRPLVRKRSTDMSAFGAALLAGLATEFFVDILYADANERNESCSNGIQKNDDNAAEQAQPSADKLPACNGVLEIIRVSPREETKRAYKEWLQAISA